MLGKTYESQVCSAARALELVGERWSLLIVRDALYAGSTRFNDFRRLGIATNILASRLDGFVAAEIMERRAYSENPELFEYVLTEKGRELASVIIALTAWGDRWAAPDGPPVIYTHTVCRGPVSSRLTCAECGEIDDVREIYVRPGPGMPEELAEQVRLREP